jgi:hypothetical protein
MLVAMGAEHLACPVVQLESVGIDWVMLDLEDGGEPDDWFFRWAGDMATGDLIASRNATRSSSMASISCRSVLPSGHLLRC